jgi:hypothetical protein
MTLRRAFIAAIVIGLLGVFANAAFEVYNYLGLKEASQTNQRLAKEALAANKSIERQRYDIAYADCRDKNRRRARTLAALQSDIKKLPPSQRAAAERRAPGTVLLIDTLLPHQNCLAAAKEPLQVPGPPLPNNVRKEPK